MAAVLGGDLGGARKTDAKAANDRPGLRNEMTASLHDKAFQQRGDEFTTRNITEEQRSWLVIFVLIATFSTPAARRIYCSADRTLATSFVVIGKRKRKTNASAIIRAEKPISTTLLCRVVSGLWER
jgi:hypothetical protein